VKIADLLLTIAVAVPLCNAQSVNISGIVTDTGGTALSGATVKLEKGRQTATTGADGRFILSGPPNGTFRDDRAPSPQIFITSDNGIIDITVRERLTIEISVYTIQGKVLFMARKAINTGTCSLPLHPKGAGVYFIKIKTETGEALFRGHSVENKFGDNHYVMQATSLAIMAKHLEIVPKIDDVIIVKRNGYLNYRVSVTKPDTSGIEIKMIICADTVHDADGNLYQAVRIGNQIWTAENLRTTKYIDGSPIPIEKSPYSWDDSTVAMYCFYQNTNNPDSISKFGALYNWYVVSPLNPNKIYPAGWHIPSRADWSVLENYLIANGHNYDKTKEGNKIAKALAAKSDWIADTITGTPGKDIRSNNSSGFSALPCGWLYGRGFMWDGKVVSWWSSTEASGCLGWSRKVRYDLNKLDETGFMKEYGFSIRLLKD
jgi:uncharacterized protein (TIGR02145 family)